MLTFKFPSEGRFASLTVFCKMFFCFNSYNFFDGPCFPPSCFFHFLFFFHWIAFPQQPSKTEVNGPNSEDHWMLWAPGGACALGALKALGGWCPWLFCHIVIQPSISGCLDPQGRLTTALSGGRGSGCQLSGMQMEGAWSVSQPHIYILQVIAWFSGHCHQPKPLLLPASFQPCPETLLVTSLGRSHPVLYSWWGKVKRPSVGSGPGHLGTPLLLEWLPVISSSF